jgi:hypothetical protein
MNCEYCDTDLTDRDPDDYCCPDSHRIALANALINLCDYIFLTDDNGDYVMGNLQDVIIEGMLPNINWVLNW